MNAPRRLSECDVSLNAFMLLLAVHRLNDRVCDLVPVCHPQHSCDTQGKKSHYWQETKAQVHKLECCVQRSTDVEQLDDGLQL